MAEALITAAGEQYPCDVTHRYTCAPLASYGPMGLTTWTPHPDNGKSLVRPLHCALPLYGLGNTFEIQMRGKRFELIVHRITGWGLNQEVWGALSEAS